MARDLGITIDESSHGLLKAVVIGFNRSLDEMECETLFWIFADVIGTPEFAIWQNKQELVCAIPFNALSDLTDEVFNKLDPMEITICKNV